MKNNYILREGDVPNPANTGANAAAAGASTDTGAAASAATGLAAPVNPVTFAAGDWRAALPAELQQDPSIRDIKDIPSLVKTHISAQRLIGTPKIALPQDNWGDKEWNETFDKLGRPVDEKGYKLPDVTTLKLPDGVREDPAAKEAFLKAFHKSGLNNKQAETLYKEYWGIQAAHINAVRAADLERTQKAAQALQTEWGPQYNERLEMAKMAAQHFGGPDFTKWMTDNNLGNDPTFIKLFYSVGASMAEDKARGKGGAAFGSSPESAAAEIKNMQADPVFMKSYLDKRDPGHAAAKAKMDALFKAANPGKMEFNTGAPR